jgi:mannose-1-phosphate guanylyltransferase
MKKTPQGQLWGIVLAADEGTRVRSFLQRLCGGRGIKQFCAVVGRRSMLQHTLARVERLIPRERILVVVASHHQPEVRQQLFDWPPKNIIYQPTNRDTAPGILLPLAYVSHRGPAATVVIFPADHFILDEERFMACVEQAAAETQQFPHEFTLLGMTPDEIKEGYGWIEPASKGIGRRTWAVRRFWEKPTVAEAQALLRRRALWNTFVCVAQVTTMWELVRKTAPALCHTFDNIRLMLNSAHAALFIAHAYETMPTLNFSSGVCEPLATWLRVLPVPKVGWSDWGSVERILASLQQMGRLEEYLARLEHHGSEAVLSPPF